MSPTPRISPAPHLLDTTFSFLNGNVEEFKSTNIPFYALGEEPDTLTAALPLFDEEYELNLDFSQPTERGRFIYAPPRAAYTLPISSAADAPTWLHCVNTLQDFEGSRILLGYVFLPFRNGPSGDVTRLYDIVTDAFIALHEGAPGDCLEAREFENLLKEMHILMINFKEPGNGGYLVCYSFDEMQLTFGPDF